jgi:branched-chain amino acid transport system ATP-binding protein
MLELEGVHVHYGNIRALQGVSLSVAEGELVALIGSNGAGKTTTLRTIMGLWAASQGTVSFDGVPLTGAAKGADSGGRQQRTTPEIARLGIAYVPENMGIFAGLTVRENLLLAARSGPLDERRLERIFSLFPAMKKFLDSAAGTLSGGQKQMLAISRAIVEPRKLLLVDEPTKGLAPAIIAAMIEAFRELKRETTLLVVEQNFQFARSLGDAVAVMESGRIVHTGAMRDLVADEALQQRLLGLSLEAHQ